MLHKGWIKTCNHITWQRGVLHQARCHCVISHSSGTGGQTVQNQLFYKRKWVSNGFDVFLLHITLLYIKETICVHEIGVRVKLALWSLRLKFRLISICINAGGEVSVENSRVGDSHRVLVDHAIRAFLTDLVDPSAGDLGEMPGRIERLI